MNRFAAIVIPCIAAVTLAGAAGASELTEADVRYQPHELATEQGREAVRERITAAARDVCRIHGARTLAAHKLRMDCIEEAEARASEEFERRIQTARMSATRLASASR